jgi:sigma-B regulation protein RsbU (phosphoserine phosphatase)
MERLIESVLDFARAKLGQGFVISWRRAPLEPSLRQIVAETAASSGNRAMEVDFDIPPAVRCDPDRVCQLFSNLLGNAIAHGAPDRPILVEARPRGGVLSISVANAGKPIPSASMEHLFQPFFRASVRRSREGLGLGLFIAHEIAVAHGGKLRAESNENETRFTFDLPLS